MSLRKFTAILMILLANIFILAHTVVPHCHHDGIVCLDSQTAKKDCMPCADDTTADNCCASNNKHHKHLDDCDLSKTIERDGNSIKDLFASLELNFQELICICSLHCYDFLSPDDIILGIYKRHTAYIDHYTSPYVGSHIGLRAPPIF